MKYIKSDINYDYYISYFVGNQVRVRACKKTKQISFNFDDVAKCLGYGSMNDLLSENKNLVINFLEGLGDKEIQQTNQEDELSLKLIKVRKLNNNENIN